MEFVGKQSRTAAWMGAASYGGDDEASAALIHLQLLQADAELCEEIQAETVDRRTLHVHHGHACRHSGFKERVSETGS